MNDDFYLGRTCPTTPVTDQYGNRLCELPTSSPTATPQATISTQPTQTPKLLPQTGANSLFWGLMVAAGAIAIMALIDSWRGRK